MENSPGLLFKPDYPHQPVATLMLVENSQAMSYIWPDLRDNHLKRLVDNLVQANPSVPITVSVLESYPCQSLGPNNSIPRQHSGYYDSLHDLTFNPNPANKITAGRVDNCIEILDSVKMQNQSAALHLIIVAATTPSDDNNLAFSGTSYSPWISLAQKMVVKNIHCHIVVSSQQDMGQLTLLFEETGNIEKSLYSSPDPTQLRFRLSAQPSYDSRIDARPSSSFPVGRTAPPRRNSYPSDNFYPENFHDPTPAAVSAEGDQPPSLVSQLQQVHGLTKKKVYGAKPVRQPFFKEERVQHKYRPPPAPLTMPVPSTEQIPSPTAGGRALSQSRADRISRLSQSSPTDVHARRQPTWARRGSRLSTPEPDLSWPIAPSGHVNNISPGSSSYMSSDLSSPVTPATTIEDVYAPSTCMPPPPDHDNSPELTPHHPGGTPEGSWPAPLAAPYVGSYNPSIQTYFPPVAQQFHSEIVQNSSDFDMQPPPLVPPATQQLVFSPPYGSPPSLSNMQTVPQQAMQAPAISGPQPTVPQQSLLSSAYSSPPPAAIMQSQQHVLPPSSYYPQTTVSNVQQPQQSMLSPSPQRASPPVISAMQMSLQNIAEEAGPMSSAVNTPEAIHHGLNAVSSAPPLPDRTAVADHPSSTSRAHKKSAPEDEERFTFGKDFVAATAVLFDEEVLPGYPNFPGMSSGLHTGGIERTLPSTLPASQAGELYATRNKQNIQPMPVNATATFQRPAASVPTSHTMGQASAMMNGITATSSSYNASYIVSYGSSLTGWAGS